MDVLSDVLSSMRLSGGVILDAEFREPWSVVSHMVPADCAPFFPVPDHMIAYHFVRSGTFWARVAGMNPIEVHPGEIILFPRNDPHVLFSSTALDPVDANSLIETCDGGLYRINWGGSGDTTTLFCGFLGSMAPEHALLHSLPPMLKVSVEVGPRSDWLESSMRFAAAELHGDTPALGRLAELLFREAIRHYVDHLPAGEGGWFAALRDPAVCRALSLLHHRYAEDWDMQKLAREVGMSRSALAERFTAALGDPPMRYWARWRLREAANRLRDGDSSAGDVAYAVGFGSEAAFSRAFKREYGVPPAAWRRRHLSAAPAAVAH